MTGFKSILTLEQVSSRAQEVILRNLRRIPGRQAKGGKPGTVTICCPFHGDHNPSCMLNLTKTNKGEAGFFYCFSCGAKGGWNKLAEKLGLDSIKEADFKDSKSKLLDTSKMRKDLLESEEEKSLEDIMADEGITLTLPFPETGKWRHIKGKTLAKIGARICVNDRSNEQQVILPVTVSDIPIGYIKARWSKAKGKRVPSYVNSEGAWTKSKGLFPFDTAIKLMKRKKLRTIVLVEGPRDALVLIQKGIPAVSILGTNNWSKKKAQMLLSEGVERVVICMDGDKAGVKCSNAVYRDIKRLVETKVVRMNTWREELKMDKLDPATLPLKYRKKLRKMVV